MSDYKRFLSYIYAYDGDYKMSGTGFAKMEVREGRYRLTVNLNCTLPGNGSDYHVGIYQHGDNGIVIADIGNPEKRSGGYIFAISGQVQAFTDGRIDIDNAGGLVVFRDAGSRIHVTCWQDPAVDIRNLRESIYSLRNIIEGESYADGSSDSRNNSQKNNEIKYDEIKYDEKKHDEIEHDEIKRDEIKHDEIKYDGINEAGTEVREEELKAAQVRDLWDEFKRMYPKMRSFKEPGWDILQIKVQDIGRLPRENWILGNNNFILHGFYRYGHLIVAKKQNPDSDVYILGVPGTFSINEKFMASMFGMTDFMEADNKRPDLPKNFGYWCTHISM